MTRACRPRWINEILHGKRSVIADTAPWLACYGSSEQFWLNMQSRHDLEVERDRLGPRIEAEVAVYPGLALKLTKRANFRGRAEFAAVRFAA